MDLPRKIGCLANEIFLCSTRNWDHLFNILMPLTVGICTIVLPTIISLVKKVISSDEILS